MVRTVKVCLQKLTVRTTGAYPQSMTHTSTPGHTVRWYVYADGVRIPRTAMMRGQWGYDAVCSCGWDSKTGGGVRSYVEREVTEHKSDVAYCAEKGHSFIGGRCAICDAAE